MSQAVYVQLCDHVREVALLRSIDGLLGWDQQTKMPAAGGDYRAEQITFLSGLIHQKQTDPRIGAWLNQLANSSLASDPHSVTGANIRGLQRSYDRKTKLPQRLVEELTRAASLGQQAWVEARRAKNFASFQPHLEKIYALKREEAQALGYAETAYDALLFDYEPEELTSNITRVLSALREELVPLVAAIQASQRRPKLEILSRSFPVASQEAFGTQAAEKIGFDFNRGRLDVTHHPFCGGAGPNDIRMTTRYDEHFFNGGFFGILHEAGHGLYEMGLDVEQYGLPAGEAISLGIHESQSRLWENLIGRSRSFWEHFYPLAQKTYPAALADVTCDEFYFAVNHAEPSLIRVEADEATYNLHILIRFELEQALIADDLKVADLPGVWNEKYQQYLGITPPDDALGVLQDIHWSAALIGYFPTYSLGNLYGSQFFEQADADLGGIDQLNAQGNFAPLLDWLRTNIHSVGQRYSAAELVERVTGKSLTHAPLMRHLRKKYGELYDLAGV